MARTRPTSTRTTSQITPQSKINQQKEVTPSPLKRVEFELDSERWIINEKETYYEFSFDLPKSNLDTYCRLLQKMYQTIRELDDKAMIIKYKTTITINEHKIGI